jgi:phage repressor protein C with HTH and peptisase S24 domain
MVVSRKEKESFVAKNLLFLRKQKGLTLDYMAEMLSLNSKSSYKAYEDGRSLPDIHKLMKLASFYDVSVADLVYQDLEDLKDKSKSEERRLFEVIKIPVAAAAGYARSFGDNNFIKKFETIKIPYEPYGIARAFDIAGDSMEPEIKNGSTVVGIRINNTEIKDNKSYIIVTNDGVQCKHVRVDNKSDIIYLISKNQKYAPKHVNKGEVIEMWEVWKTL